MNTPTMTSAPVASTAMGLPALPRSRIILFVVAVAIVSRLAGGALCTWVLHDATLGVLCNKRLPAIPAQLALTWLTFSVPAGLVVGGIGTLMISLATRGERTDTPTM